MVDDAAVDAVPGHLLKQTGCVGERGAVVVQVTDAGVAAVAKGCPQLKELNLLIVDENMRL